MTKQTL